MKTKLVVALLASAFCASAELPRESSELIKKLDDWEKQQREELKKKITEKRAEVSALLRAQLERTTKSGDLEGALAIKEELERLAQDPDTRVVKEAPTLEESDLQKIEPFLGKWNWNPQKDIVLAIEASGRFILSAMVKGGWDADYWGVMVTKFPAALKTAKTNEEKMKLLEGMEMKMIVIGYDGTVSFPEEDKDGGQGEERRETGRTSACSRHLTCALFAKAECD